MAGEDKREVDPGLWCLSLLLSLNDRAVDHEQLRHQLGGTGAATLDDVTRLARKAGASAKLTSIKADRLPDTPLPALAESREGQVFIIGRMNEDMVLVQMAGSPPEELPLKAFIEIWSGRLMLLTSRIPGSAASRKFDVTWFIPALVRYRGLIGDVLVASFVLQLFALATPLFSKSS